MALPAPDALPAPLTAVQFQTLADVPPEIAWFANLTNPNTRRAYRQDMRDFQAFTGLRRPEEFRDVTRAHVIAWREHLTRQQLANDTIRRKLAALSSLYAYLCERHAVLHNPVLGVKRPRSMNREGVTPAIGEHQARTLLEAPPEHTLKGQRDRAILATLLYHAIRREELCTLKVGDVQQRQGVPYLRIEGKGDKVRYNRSRHRGPAADRRLSEDGRACPGPGRAAVPAREEQHHHNPRQAPAPGVCLPGCRPALCPRGRIARRGARPLRPFPTGDGRHHRPGTQSGHRQGAGLARACGHRHHTGV